MGTPAADFLARMQAKGVRFWLSDDRLRYTAPRGSLDEVSVAAICQHHRALARLLRAQEASNAHPARQTFLADRAGCTTIADSGTLFTDDEREDPQS